MIPEPVNTCDDCAFNADLGGPCKGMQKNQEARVPFYVCPHAEDREKLLEYESGATANLAGVPPVFRLFTTTTHQQRASSAA